MTNTWYIHRAEYQAGKQRRLCFLCLYVPVTGFSIAAVLGVVGNMASNAKAKVVECSCVSDLHAKV